MHYREADLQDLHKILQLYKAVAAGEGLARKENEITENYISEFLEKSIANGLIIVGEHPDDPEQLVAEIHGYKNGIGKHHHVLTAFSLVVHPDFQGRKMGRTILTIFLEEIARHRPDIGKVELMTFEDNTRALKLYQSSGFRVEGRLEMRMKTEDGRYIADIPMGWQNPNFEF
jgi:putative acetyltransferase